MVHTEAEHWSVPKCILQAPALDLRSLDLDFSIPFHWVVQVVKVIEQSQVIDHKVFETVYPSWPTFQASSACCKAWSLIQTHLEP